jgi:hypothetical protein
MRSKEIEGLLSDSGGYDEIKDLITNTVYVVTYCGNTGDARTYETESEFMPHVMWLGKWGENVDYHMRIDMGEYLRIEYDQKNGIIYPTINYGNSYIDEVHSSVTLLCSDIKKIYGEHLELLETNKLGEVIDKL